MGDVSTFDRRRRHKMLILSWNKLVGFDQFNVSILEKTKGDTLLQFVDNYLSKLPTMTVSLLDHTTDLQAMVITTGSLFIAHRFDMFLAELHDGSFQTMGRGHMYNLEQNIAQTLDDVHAFDVNGIARCFQLQLKTTTCQNMAYYMRKFAQSSGPFSMLINNKGKSQIFVLENSAASYDDSEEEDEQDETSEYKKCITLRLPGNINCFHVIFNMREKTSELHSLLYNVATPQLACHGLQEIGKNGIAKWLISVLDQINSAAGIKHCTLIDASTFRNVRADCAYAKTHNGLSFYNSLGFLAYAPSKRSKLLLSKDDSQVKRAFKSSENDITEQKPNLMSSIKLTNVIIEYFCQFWSTRQHLDSKHVCTNQRDINVPAAYHELIKFYGKQAMTLDLFIPHDKNKPAVFSLLD